MYTVIFLLSLIDEKQKLIHLVQLTPSHQILVIKKPLSLSGFFIATLTALTATFL
jgi:hypothetical protein